MYIMPVLDLRTLPKTTTNMATAKATPTTATSEKIEKRSTVKLDTIREIEQQMQKQWADLKVFEADALVNATDK